MRAPAPPCVSRWHRRPCSRRRYAECLRPYIGADIPRSDEQLSVHDHVSVHDKCRILTDIDRMTASLRLSLPHSTDFGNANSSTQGQSPLMADLMRGWLCA